jgi:hypothetical protein
MWMNSSENKEVPQHPDTPAYSRRTRISIEKGTPTCVIQVNHVTKKGSVFSLFITNLVLYLDTLTF